MFQLRHRDVPDAGEQPDLMVNEKQGGIFRREALRVFCGFHRLFSFLLWQRLRAKQTQRKYLVAWIIIPTGYDLLKWNSVICDTLWLLAKGRTCHARRRVFISRSRR